MLKHWLAPLGLRGRGSRGATAGGSMLTLAGLGSTHVTRPGRAPAIDATLMVVVSALILIGTVMVYSASISLADSPRFNVAPTHFLVRHLLSLGIAFTAAVLVFQNES